MSAHPDLPRITRTDPEAEADADADADTDPDTDSATRTVHLPLLCFNDVYRVSQRYVPQPGAPKLQPGTDPDAQITVAQFGQLLLSEREKWADKPRRTDWDSLSATSASATATSASESEGYSSVTISDIDDASESARSGLQTSDGGGDTPAPSGSEGTADKDKEKEKEKEGLVLFAGDVFNPSVESAVTRGSHMVSDPAPLFPSLFTPSGAYVP
jgi:5'-nucleotidase